MKNLSSLVLLLFLSSNLAFGQFRTDLTGNILKIEDRPIAKDVSIEDFSFQPNSNGFKGTLQTQPGLAFLSSAILPGTAQAANGKWARAGIYLATEAFSIFYYINRTNVAKDQEQAYEAFTHKEWSVVAYSQWLIGYYDNNGLSHDKLNQLRAMVDGLNPDFSDTRNDWNRVNINLLQEIERETELVCGSCGTGDFSHVLPAYGSQQYYELISKYYQFEGGWSDFYAENVAINNPDYNYLYDNEGDLASPLFLLGAERADRFNNNYRRAGNILNLLVLNHVVSAFDALFSVKLKNARVQASADMMRADSFSLTLHF